MTNTQFVKMSENVDDSVSGRYEFKESGQIKMLNIANSVQKEGIEIINPLIR